MRWLLLAVLSFFWLNIPPAVPTPEPAASCLSSPKDTKETDQRVCWWEIKILLTSKGKYKYTECQTSFAGNYAYTIRWTGCIEKDQHDFLLYHENSDLLFWEPMEKIFTSDAKPRATKKFSGKPSFELHYILKRGKKLHFDFLVKGFDIPQNCSAKKAYLHLPASKGNSDNPTQLDYDLYISKGSNDVAISSEILDMGCVKKDFRWTWQRKKRFGSGQDAPYLFHVHDVDVEVSVIRHIENTP